jgi:hypothetical protein
MTQAPVFVQHFYLLLFRKFANRDFITVTKGKVENFCKTKPMTVSASVAQKQSLSLFENHFW